MLSFKLRTCFAPAVLAAALIWLPAAAFLPEQSLWLPVLIAPLCALLCLLPRWPRMVPAISLALLAAVSAVCWPYVRDGAAAMLNGVLDAWTQLHGRNTAAFSVSRDPAVFLCLLAVVCGLWSADYAQRHTTAAFALSGSLLAAMVLLFAPVLSGLWLLIAALTLLLIYALHFGGGAAAGTWMRTAALMALCTLLLGGLWDKPAALDRALHWADTQIQQMRYGDNRCVSLPGGDLRSVGPRSTADDVCLLVTMQQPASYYLRGFVGDVYADSRWDTLDNTDRYPAADAFYWLHADSYYAQAQIAAAAAQVLPELTETSNTLYAENVGLCSQYLYAPYELLPDDKALDPCTIAESSLLAPGLRGTRQYTLSTAGELVAQYQRINAALAQQDCAFLDSEAAYNAFAYQHYTQLPADIRSYLTDKLGAYTVEDGGHFDVQSAKQNILYYLNTYIQYEESDIAAVAEGADFILTFLDGTQKGYDVHYASAAAMMFRYYGIPARYVEGFLITKEDARTAQAGQPLTIDGTHAHAWVEYYQDGVGWLPFEVTPAYFSVMEQPEQYQDISGLIGQKPQEEIADNIDDPSPDDSDQDPSFLSFWLKYRLKILLVLLVLVLLALVVLFVFWLIWERKKAVRLRTSFRTLAPSAAICAMFTYIARLLRAQDITLKNIPPEDYAAFLAEELRPAYRQAAAIWQESRFSTHPMSEEQRQQLLPLVEAIWRRMDQDASLFRKFYYRYVLFL